MRGDEFYQQLENDLKNLAAEAKRSDTFTGQLSGLLLLSGPEHPHIREATDRSLTKLRTWREDGAGRSFVIDKVGPQKPFVPGPSSPLVQRCGLIVELMGVVMVPAGFSQAFSCRLREQKQQAHHHIPCQPAKAASK